MRDAKLGDFLAKRSRGIVPASMPDETFELYSVPAFEGKRPEVVTGGQIGSNKQIVEPGTVLLCKINPRINRAWTVGSFTRHQKIASTEWITFPPHPDVEPRYLAHYLSRKEIRDYLAANASGVGGSLMRVKASTVEDLPLPLPNVAEQRRIVAELEKQFSRLDEAVANLKRVKVNLKRNRAAVLKAAVEGRLVPTEAELARREGRSYESGATLACRILDARRTRWTGRGKYKETTAADVTCLPELPEGWTWVSLDALSWDSGYGTSVKCSYEGQGLAVLRIPNVQNGAIDLSDLKFGPPDFSPPSGELLDVGDMLVIRTNGSKALIGRAAIVNQLPPRPLAFASYLIRFRLCESEGIAKWVNLVWAESRSRKWIEARAATSAGQHNISQSMLATAPIPLPPAKELIRIAVEVDRCLSMLREVEAGVDASLIRAIALRQAVLTRGFS